MDDKYNLIGNVLKPDENQRRIQYDNYLSTLINTLHAIKHQQNVTWEQKLQALVIIEKHIPQLRRFMIYFGSKEKK